MLGIDALALSSSISFLIFSPSHKPSLSPSLPSPPIVFLSHHIPSLLLVSSTSSLFSSHRPTCTCIHSLLLLLLLLLPSPSLPSSAHSSLTLHISPQLTILSYKNMYIIPLSLPSFLLSQLHTHLHAQQIQQYQNKQ